MRALWIWGGALVVYGVFSLWYNSWGQPLTQAEIDDYMERAQASSEAPDARLLSTLRGFLEADDGGEFFMLNLIRLHQAPVTHPGSGEKQPARNVLEVYMSHMMRALFVRACHPAFVGRPTASYVEHWGVEPDPGWTFAAIIRYRSRRDMMDVATDPAFAQAHPYKFAAIANTLAFPVVPGMIFFGPRLWFALALLLLASLGHLLLHARRST